MGDKGWEKYMAGGGPDAQGGNGNTVSSNGVESTSTAAVYDRPDDPARQPDLVGKLRAWAEQWRIVHGFGPVDPAWRLITEAADEIERLRAGLREEREVMLKAHNPFHPIAFCHCTLCNRARRLLGEEM